MGLKWFDFDFDLIRLGLGSMGFSVMNGNACNRRSTREEGEEDEQRYLIRVNRVW